MVAFAATWGVGFCSGFAMARTASAAHGVIVGRDESALDGTVLVTCFVGEGYFLGPPDRCPWWHSPCRGRCMVVVAGNFLKLFGRSNHIAANVAVLPELTRRRRREKGRPN